MSEEKRSENDRVLPRSNSGEAQFGAKKTSCCCTCSATPRKSSISCDPETKLGQRNAGSEN
ncbi:hypothetical protein FXV91_17635 [Methanosarcina sp. DH2]|uniref:hypothetical protein n=1 Tax=Methanosarcina sp. DH2 TaxID=2605639 RepID=UPI001E37053E|nr:hypothetical protein [Methanosarcina sp. DH2]MCC4771918.1 hypothetical protein [Methanosarcina sp. DH2]